MDTTADLSQRSLAERFLRGLARSPEREAVRTGGHSLTYRELHRLALRWAGALGDRDAPRSPVAVLAADGLSAYAGVLAALYSAAPVVPLHPGFPPARLRRMMEAAGVGAVIADRAGCERLGQLAFPAGRGPVLLAPEGPAPRSGPSPRHRLALLDAEAAVPLAAPRPTSPDAVAYVLFTSGSTGVPKGVPISHRAALAYFAELDRRYDFGPDDTFSQTFALTFDCAVFDLFGAWGHGAGLVGVPPHAYRDLPGFLAAEGISVWFSAPSSIGLVRRTTGLPPGAFPSLRWSCFAGEALTCRDAAEWQRAAPGSVVENLYGPTELTVTIASHRWDEAVSPHIAAHGIVPIGAVHPGHPHLLLDAGGEAAGSQEGAEGELCVAGPQVTAGYLDPAQDEGRFVEVDGRRHYRTGDLVRRGPGAQLLYLGRRDSQVQIHGRRVELAEVDHAVAACPGVAEAVTVALTGEEGTVLVVYYTGSPQRPVDLARQLRAELPPGVLPRRFQHLERLPLNANRKVDRQTLTAWAREGGPAA